MALWNVMYQDWQMECCGKPFRVGDEVAWQLLVDEAGQGREWRSELTEIEGPVESAGGGPVVRLAGVTVPWTGDGSWPPRVRLRGLLSVERHGGKWPETAGLVRGIQIVEQGYLSGERVAGERWLRPVEACPKWFKRAVSTETRKGAEYRRDETGALVSLEVG
ncbi:DUF6578 domain-containing protein [Streptomyces sp. NPDC058308]|uniref:DUF6578 domain-containing protein n=1 Tax=Streptomyces sp. NPDC058308 TaxID=3346440 RepID=UPI0036EDC2B6